jgi:hypothetical protein
MAYGLSSADLVTIVANIALVVSVVVLSYQVLLQRRELKYSSYEKLMSDFSNAAVILVQERGLRDVFVSGDEPRNWRRYTEDEKTAYFYFDSLIGLFERVWVSYKELHWSTEEDWNQWRNWIAELKRNKVFVDVLLEAKEDGLFDPKFMSEMKQVGKRAS